MVSGRVKGVSAEERKRCDEAIADAFLSLGEYPQSECVFVYIGVGSEVSTDAILKKLFSDKKIVCVPLCHGKGIMDAIRIESEEDLSPGRYGIPEPSADGVRIGPEKIDLAIIPGVAFGEDGMRLGRGAGYYDRFLNRAKKAKKVALAREVCVYETVPCEEHDESADIIVTEKRVIKVRSGD